MIEVVPAVGLAPTKSRGLRAVAVLIRFYSRRAGRWSRRRDSHSHEVALGSFSNCCVSIPPRRVKLVPEAGLAPAWPFGRHILSVVCMHSTTPGEKGGSEKWSHHRDLRPALSDTNGSHRFLCFGGVVQVEGLAPTESRRTERLQRAAFAALPHLDKRCWGEARVLPPSA